MSGFWARPASRSRDRSSGTAGSTTCATGDELRRRLAAKNRYNLRHHGVVPARAVVLRLRAHRCSAWPPSTSTTVRYAHAVIALRRRRSSSLFTAVYFVLVERASSGFRALRPTVLLDLRPVLLAARTLLEGAGEASLLQIFNGTPFKNVIWRLLGVRLGRRVFDDGCCLTERTLVTIGDDCTLNAGSEIQCHSQEDGTFKSDRITIGAGCTLGVGALVHYGVTMGDGAVLAPDSFLMKGEEVPPHARWGGNPAREMRRPAWPACRSAGTAATTARRSGRRQVAPWQRRTMSGGKTRWERWRRPAGSSGAVCSSPAGSPRSRGGPSIRWRVSPSTRRRSPTTWWRRCAGWRTSWRCRSARCCWPRTPRCWPRCPASARS